MNGVQVACCTQCATPIPLHAASSVKEVEVIDVDEGAEGVAHCVQHAT